MATKKKQHENLTRENIQKVISLLEADKPVTKKEACEILNIAYNTTRLTKIINEFKEVEAYAASRRAANRGKAATAQEVQFIASEYLKGVTVSRIAAQLFRSSGFVKTVVNSIGVPQRGEDVCRNVDILPEQCVSEEFQKNDMAWSTQYHTLVKVLEELSIEFQESKLGMKVLDYEAKYGCKAYNVLVIEDVESEDTFFPGVETGGYYASVLACELGSLKHLEALGVQI